MDCNHPNLQLEQKAVVCNECGKLVAKKVKNSKNRVLRTDFNVALTSAIKSPLTLVLAIAMSVFTISCFANAISSGDSPLSIVSVVLGAFALKDCIGIWKLWGFDKDITIKSLRSFKGYIKLQMTLNSIMQLGFYLLAALLLFVSITATVAFDQFSVTISEFIYKFGSIFGYELLIDPDTILAFLIIGPSLLFIIAVLIIILATAYFTIINRALTKIIEYTKRISKSMGKKASYTDKYNLKKKPPFISLIIFGGLYVVCAPFTFGLWNIIGGLALGVYFIFIALLFKKIHNEIEENNALFIGTATHEFIENCDLESFNQNGSIAELDRLVDEKYLTSDDADRIQFRLYEMELFRRSDVFREMLAAKRAEDAHLVTLLESIRQTKAHVMMGLPECIENMDLGKLYDELYVMKVIEDMRQTGDPHQIELADVLNEETRHYELPAEMSSPETLEKIRQSKLFEDIRKAKRLYREYPIFLPDVSSTVSPHTLVIIDCIIVKESGEVSIVDYKTDRLKKNQIKNEIKATKTFSTKYSFQLSKYDKAVKLEFGKDPVSARVYSLQLGKSLQIPITGQSTDKYSYSTRKFRPS